MQLSTRFVIAFRTRRLLLSAAGVVTEMKTFRLSIKGSHVEFYVGDGFEQVKAIIAKDFGFKAWADLIKANLWNVELSRIY